MRMSWCLAVAVALAACGHKDGKDEARGQAGSGSGSAAVAASREASVAIFVDDKQVGTIAAPQIALWPRLDTLVPVSARHLGSWEDVFLKGATEKSSQIHSPSARYPDLVPALYPGDGGKPAFGMFDPVELAKKGKPQVSEPGITEIHIKMSEGSARGQNEQGEGGGADPMEIKVTVKTPKGEQVIEGPKLLAVPREPMPGETDPRGWTLATFMKIAGITTYQRVRLTDAAGLTLTLEKQDLDPKTSIPYLKLNRQGGLRVKVFKKQGDGWNGTGDLRGLTLVEVLK